MLGKDGGIYFYMMAAIWTGNSALFTIVLYRLLDNLIWPGLRDGVRLAIRSICSENLSIIA